MNITGIYKIQSVIKPERIYIGSSVNIYRRWNGHMSSLKRGIHHSQKLQRHFDKYGEADLQFSILLGCDKEDRIKIEQYFLDSHKPYFNNLLQAKPVKCIPHTEETKDKMRIGRIGRRLSDETKEKIRQKKLGVPLTKEHRERCRQGQLNGKHPVRTKEWNKKISDAQKGRKLTEEHKKKLSEAKKGYVPWNKGRKKPILELICQN